MESEKYLEGNIVFKPPYFENISFLEWKIRFETYVKSIDYNLWQVISIGDFQPINTIFKEQNKLAKIIIYKALPNDEYERIIFCQTANEMWKNLLNFHQEECQAKENNTYKLIINESIVDKYLVEINTSATSSNLSCEGNDAENSISHDESKQEGCIEVTIEKELSDDDYSSSESEDEEYAKVVKEFKSILKKRQRAQDKRKAS